MNRVSFDQCKTHDSATLDLIKSAKQPGGAKRFVDRHDSNGYWICSGANCMKYCRKPFALMRSENTITRRRCEKSTDGYKWSDAESAPARCEKEGFHLDFYAPFLCVSEQKRMITRKSVTTSIWRN